MSEQERRCVKCGRTDSGFCPKQDGVVGSHSYGSFIPSPSREMSAISKSVYFCTDGVECCALKYAIGHMDEALDRAPLCGLREMRNWLVSQYNAYASGELECSRCRDRKDSP